MKKCKACLNKKEFKKFSKRNDSSDGYKNICKQCHNEGKKIDKTQNFIDKAFKIHGDKYNYSKVKYTKARENVIIICKTHGKFPQRPNNHLCGKGCPHCANDDRRSTTEDFIRLAKEVHGDKYDYSLSEYVKEDIKIRIICPKHGTFNQGYRHHIHRKQGCDKCARNVTNRKRKKGLKSNKKLSNEECISRFIKSHGHRYRYSEVRYEGSAKPVKIFCRVHGYFYQNPYSHWKGQGCDKCGRVKASRTMTHFSKELKKMSTRLRSRVQKYINKRGLTKSKSTVEILGIDWEGLKEYLEDNPYGFKIDDPDIDIDHIIPLSSADTEEELYKLCQYTNLQLLPSYYNRWVKKYKLFDKEHFENWLKENRDK